MDGDMIPIIGEHRGVGLHDCQSPARLRVVKADIDDAFALETVEELFAFANDVQNAPEARLFAGAKLEALYEVAAGNRQAAPIDIDKLRAIIAGLDSVYWRNPLTFGSLLDPRRGVGREEPLE